MDAEQVNNSSSFLERAAAYGRKRREERLAKKASWSHERARRALADELVCTLSEVITTKTIDNFLNSETWLNDDIINGFMYCVFLRTKSIDVSKVGLLKSQFFDLILSEKTYYQARQWFYNVSDPTLWNIFELDALVMPINLRKTHWALVLVDVVRCTVTLYDSSPSGKNTSMVLSNLKQFLESEHRVQHSKPLPDFWRFTIADTERQDDGYNCGVFVARFIEIFGESWTGRRPSLPICSACFTTNETPNAMRQKMNVIMKLEYEHYKDMIKVYKNKDLYAVFILASVPFLSRLRVRMSVFLSVDLVKLLYSFLF